MFWTNQHVVNLFGCEPTQALTLNLGLLGATSQRQAIHIELQNRAEVSRPVATLSPTDTDLAQICELDLVRRYPELFLHLPQRSLLRPLARFDSSTEQAPVGRMGRRV